MNKIIITIIAISMLYPADNTVNVKGNEKNLWFSRNALHISGHRIVKNRIFGSG